MSPIGARSFAGKKLEARRRSPARCREGGSAGHGEELGCPALAGRRRLAGKEAGSPDVPPFAGSVRPVAEKDASGPCSGARPRAGKGGREPRMRRARALVARTWQSREHRKEPGVRSLAGERTGSPAFGREGGRCSAWKEAGDSAARRSASLQGRRPAARHLPGRRGEDWQPGAWPAAGEKPGARHSVVRRDETGAGGDRRGRKIIAGARCPAAHREEKLGSRRGSVVRHVPASGEETGTVGSAERREATVGSGVCREETIGPAVRSLHHRERLGKSPPPAGKRPGAGRSQGRDRRPGARKEKACGPEPAGREAGGPAFSRSQGREVRSCGSLVASGRRLLLGPGCAQGLGSSARPGAHAEEQRRGRPVFGRRAVCSAVRRGEDREKAGTPVRSQEGARESGITSFGRSRGRKPAARRSASCRGEGRLPGRRGEGGWSGGHAAMRRLGARQCAEKETGGPCSVGHGKEPGLRNLHGTRGGSRKPTYVRSQEGGGARRFGRSVHTCRGEDREPVGLFPLFFFFFFFPGYPPQQMPRAYLRPSLEVGSKQVFIAQGKSSTG